MFWGKFSICATIICCFSVNVLVCTIGEAASFCNFRFIESGVFESDLLNDNRDDLNPVLQTDAQGVWISAWLQHVEPDNPLSRARSYIVLKRSEDNGLTWQESKGISCVAGACYNYATSPRLATDGDGVWVVTWTDKYSGSTVMGNIIYSRSTDNGQSWSIPKRMNSFPAQASVQSSVDTIAFGRDTWIVGGVDFDGGDESVYYYRSLDNGLTWSGPSFIDATWQTSKFGVKLATDHNGTVLAAWTSGDSFNVLGENKIMTSTSTDDGQNWSDPKAQGFQQEAGVKIGDLKFSSSSGNWVMAWSSDKNLDNPTGGDVSENILYSYSQNQGSTWSPSAWLFGSAADIKDDVTPRLYIDTSGNVSCAWQRSSGSEANVAILRSCSITGGSSWPPPSNMNQFMEAKVHIEEAPAMAMGKGEKVFALWSSNRAADGAVSEESTLFLSPGVSGRAGGSIVGCISVLLLDQD